MKMNKTTVQLSVGVDGRLTEQGIICLMANTVM